MVKATWRSSLLKEIAALRKKLARAEARGRRLTKSVRAEQALHESEERYRRLFEDDLTGDYLAEDPRCVYIPKHYVPESVHA